MKSIILITIVLLGCIAFSHALDCYSHSTCSTNCPQLKDVKITCPSSQDKCYKAAFPGGVSRGCARDRCNVQIDATSTLANVCCGTDLCNSAITPKMTISAFLMVIGAFILARM